MNKKEILNDILNKNIIEKEGDLKFINRKINQINNNIINYQHLYKLLKENGYETKKKNSFNEDINNINIKIDFNTIYKKKRRMPRSHIKIIDQMKEINQHFLTDEKINSKNEYKKFKDKYNDIINSVKPVDNVDTITNLKNNTLEKNKTNRLFLAKQKDTLKRNLSQRQVKIQNQKYLEKNIFNSNNKNIGINNYSNKTNKTNKRIRIDFSQYAFNNYNFKNPRLLILNKNNKLYSNTKLPILKNLSNKSIKEPKVLSDYIPQNTKLFNLKHNFYNYYIRNKLLPQQKFIL